MTDRVELVDCQKAAQITDIYISQIYYKRKSQQIPSVEGKNNRGRIAWAILTKDNNKLATKPAKIKKAIIFVSKDSDYKNIPVKKLIHPQQISIKE